jgi:O-antigen ligase
MGALNRELTAEDRTIYIAAMVLLILVGMVGAYFHIQADLTSQSTIVPERFLRGAPFMSPLLFSNMGIVGLLALLSPKEK